jgi:hypothetical protein
MNKAELIAKIIQSKAVGVPVFLTEVELRWLLTEMISMADLLRTLEHPTQQAKDDFVHAVGIGVKCALELGLSPGDFSTGS